MKRIVFLLFSLTMIACTSQKTQHLETFRIIADKIDPTDREFPGGRGTDQLIVYTSNFGNKTDQCSTYGSGWNERSK